MSNRIDRTDAEWLEVLEDFLLETGHYPTYKSDAQGGSLESRRLCRWLARRGERPPVYGGPVDPEHLALLEARQTERRS